MPHKVVFLVDFQNTESVTDESCRNALKIECLY